MSSTVLHRFKASDLLKDDQEKHKLRLANYRIEFQKCLDTIANVNMYSHNNFTFYKLPLVLPGDPHFELQECIAYFKEELARAEFYVKLKHPGDILLISWHPQHVKLVQDQVQRRKEKQRKEKEKEKAKVKKDEGKGTNLPVKETPRQIDFQPDSALSNLSLRSSLMKDNPKYAHLKSIQKLKSRGKR